MEVNGHDSAILTVKPRSQDDSTRDSDCRDFCHPINKVIHFKLDSMTVSALTGNRNINIPLNRCHGWGDQCGR